MPKSTNRSRPTRRRSELERLLDLTVLEPTHPELGTCWQFMGTATPYGRMAKAQDSYTHRLGWKLLRGPIPEGKELHHRCGIYACWNPDHLQIVTPCRELGLQAQDALQARAPAVRRQRPGRPTDGGESLSGVRPESQPRFRATARRQTSDRKPHSPVRGKPGLPRGRTDLERMLDRTVLGRSDPEVGTCWVYTGPTKSLWTHREGS
jgi:hypothetical protein